jgi:hypothetical protein
VAIAQRRDAGSMPQCTAVILSHLRINPWLTNKRCQASTLWLTKRADPKPHLYLIRPLTNTSVQETQKHSRLKDTVMMQPAGPRLWETLRQAPVCLSLSSPDIHTETLTCIRVCTFMYICTSVCACGEGGGGGRKGERDESVK